MRIALLVFLVMASLVINAQTLQTYNTDSLKQLLSHTVEDTNRVWVLVNLGRNIRDSDTTLALAEQAISLSKKLNFKKGEAEAYNNIGYWHNQKGDYPRALAQYLKSIQLSESIHYKAGLKRSYNSISTVYLYVKDYVTSMSYARRARSISIELSDRTTESLASSWLSKSFVATGQIDSAMRYAEEAYQIAVLLKEPFPLYLASGVLGEINMIQHKIPQAIEYSRTSLRYSKIDGRNFRIAGAHDQLAHCFDLAGEKDSCRHHAKMVFTIAMENNLSGALLSSSLLLSRLYEGIDDAQSLQFHKLAMSAQDSLFSQEKNRELDMLSLNETLRQQELEEARLKAEEDRRHNIQYATIVLGIILFSIAFLLLSRTLIVNERVIRFLTILALLVVFELFNLILHPFIGSVTHHLPFLMLLIMVAVAALLIPLHHKLEKIITHRLVEKNKEIRMAVERKESSNS